MLKASIVNSLAAALLIATSVSSRGQDDTLFYASFDVSLDADTSKGDGNHKKRQAKITAKENGKEGGALDLSQAGPPNYLTLAYALDGNLLLSEGTVQFWYKPMFPRATTDKTPFVSYFLFDLPTMLKDGNNQVVRVALSVSENGGQRRVWLNSGAKDPGSGKPVSAVVDWQSGEWHHVALTWNAEELLLYLDGAPVSSVYSKGGLFGGDPEALASLVGLFCVGGAWSSGAKASAGGLIDEFRISGKALDVFQVNN